MARIARNMLLALSVGLMLASCGKKSDLQRPMVPPDVAKDPGNQKAPDPNRPFILDPILGK